MNSSIVIVNLKHYIRLFQLQYAPAKILDRLPSGMGTKSFTFSQGKVIMEVTLDKEVYYHGEKIEPIVAITNNSSKSVKNIKVGMMTVSSTSNIFDYLPCFFF